MADVVQELRREIEGTIFNTWPDIAEVILTEQQAKRRAYQDIPLPYAILDLMGGSEGEWGIGNLAMERRAVIHKITEWSDDAEQLLANDLGRLKHRLAVATHPNSGATWLPRTEDDCSPESDLNRILIEKNLQVIGGTLFCWYVAGETIGSLT